MGAANRQPDLAAATCDNALCSEPTSTGTMYWAKPGNVTGARSNYTLHSSQDGGASWDFVDRVYAGGAGYSDATVVPDGQGGFRCAPGQACIGKSGVPARVVAAAIHPEPKMVVGRARSAEAAEVPAAKVVQIRIPTYQYGSMNR